MIKPIIEPIQRQLQRQCGLDLSSTVVDSALRRAMRRMDSNDRIAFTAQVLAGGPAFDALVEQVVVPETWFFRDAEAFSAAAQITSDKHARLNRPIRILSLPCASGEEPYSIAMALRDTGIHDGHFRIEGIDISHTAIARAQHAVYQEKSFRNRDLAFRDRHFTLTEQGFALAPHIRRLVKFRQGNLFDSAMERTELSAAFDLIFCRNLLIYFDQAKQAAAIRKLDALLQPEGLLFVGYAEAATLFQHGFAVAPFPRAFALQRAVPEAPATLPALPGTLAVPFLQCIRSMQPIRPALQPPPFLATAAAGIAKRRPTVGERAGVLLEQAQSLADQGKTQEAREKFASYLDAVPDSADAHFMLGLLSEKQRDTAAAENHLRRAVYLNPNHYEALCHLALLAEHQGDASGASLFKRRAARVYRRRNGEHIE
jgi:chemotaxis protein methyltransferase WspC